MKLDRNPRKTYFLGSLRSTNFYNINQGLNSNKLRRGKISADSFSSQTKGNSTLQFNPAIVWFPSNPYKEDGSSVYNGEWSSGAYHEGRPVQGGAR